MATLITLLSFNGTDGTDPTAGLIADAAGDLFGTTYEGGAFGGDAGYGTVFEIANTATGYASTPTTLVSFNYTDGANPDSSLIADANGDLFCTTGIQITQGVAMNYGTAFEIANTSAGYASTPTTLVSFNSPAYGVIADAAGDLFGTTLEGGANNDGTVFEIAKTGAGYASTATTLVSFNKTNGYKPSSGVIADANGNLFGTTYAGGANNDGTVFEIANTGAGYASIPTVLVSFNKTNGENPLDSLIADAAGDLFGTTAAGGAHNDGTVFEIAKTATGFASAPTTIVSFNGTNGDGPSNLIADAAGDLFGTTSEGGANNDGTVFEIAKTATGYANTPTPLVSFNYTDGAIPGDLIADAAGDLFGTTGFGGANSDGTVFEITGSGFVTTASGPTIAITSSGGLTNQVTQTITGTIDAADAGLTISIYDGSILLGTAMPAVDGTWSKSVTLSGDGTHNLTAQATDAANDLGTSATDVYALATQAPAANAVETLSGLTDKTSDTITVTASAEAVSGNSIATVAIYDGANLLGAATSNGNGTWSYTASGLADGNHAFHAVVTDAAGNQTTTNALTTVTVATQAPAASAVETLSGLTDKTFDTITLTASAEAVSGNSIATVAIYDGANLLGAATSNGDGTWSYLAGGLADGDHAFFAVVTDAAGNQTMTSALPTLTVATQAPAASAVETLSGLTDKTFDTITLTASAEAVSGNSIATVAIYDGANLLGAATSNGDGTWSYLAGGLADGDHAFFAVVTDAAGNQTMTSALPTLTVATQAPAASAVETLSGLTDKTSDTITVTASAEAVSGNSIATVAIYDGANLLGAATSNGNGTWSYTASGLADGNHAFHAVVTDAAGNQTTTNALTTVTVATQAPAASAVETLSGLTDKTSDTITVTASAEAVTGNSIATVAIYDGANLLGAATSNGNGTWSYTASGLANGNHAFHAVVTDAAGNQTTTNALTTVTVATQAPAASAVETLSGLTDKKSDTITVTASAEAVTGNSIATVAIYDGANLLGAATSNGNGTWSFTASGLADGNHAFHAVVTDAAGNQTTTNALTTVTVATQAPAASAVETLSGLTDKTSDTITVTASAEAVSGNSIATVAIYDGNTLLGAATSNGDGTWSFTASGLADGNHAFHAIVTDAAGNQTTTGALTTLTVATQAPTVVIVNTGGLTNQATQTISGKVTGTEAAIGAEVALYDNGGTTPIGTATVGTGGAWSTNVTLIGDGSHSIIAEDTDAAGNTGGSSPAVFTVVAALSEFTASDTIDLSTLAYKASFEAAYYAGSNGGTLQIIDTANADAVVATLNFSGSPSGEVFALGSDGGLGLDITLAATPAVMLTAGDVVFSNISGQAYSAYEQLYSGGVYMGIDYFFTNGTGQPYASYEYEYSAGNDFIGSDFFYTTVLSGANYTGYEYDYNGNGHVTRIDITGVSGTGYSSYEFDYVGGTFAGSKFEVTSVPAGATYSSYELDYNSANAFIGDKFFFSDVAGQSYTDAEEDFDASGKLAKVLLSGVTGQPYSSLEEDYSAGSYTGYKAFYTGITGQNYTGEEVDVSASNQLQKVVYTGITSAPYSSVEQDYANGSLSDAIYSFTDVSGASAYAYQVEDSASGTALQETFDNNDGSHTIIGQGATGQTFTSIGNDTVTGGGSNETFVFQPIYGSDTITDFSQFDTGSGHDTISLSTSEFANFGAVTSAASNVGSNLVINAADGDTLTLANLNTTTLAGLSADFTFHA